MILLGEDSSVNKKGMYRLSQRNIPCVELLDIRERILRSCLFFLSQMEKKRLALQSLTNSRGTISAH